MAHIAIIGTEGSGKTILATVWARRLAHSTESRLSLAYQNIETERYVERAWANISNGQWLPSTPPGTRIELEWLLQHGTFECPIKLIDLPGQDLRNFFSGNYNTLGRDSQELFDYVASASIVFAVINLERILKYPESEDRIVLSEIVRFLTANTNTETQHLYFVFTAWDKVATEVLDKYSSLTNYIRTELTPFYRTCENAWNRAGKGIYFLAVAPVAQTVYDLASDGFVPKKDFKNYNLDNFTKVLIQSIIALQNNTAKPPWNPAIVHPYDEELLNEWRNRERDMKRKIRLNKFLGVKNTEGSVTFKHIWRIIVSIIVVSIGSVLGLSIGSIVGAIVGVIIGGIHYYAEAGVIGMVLGFLGGIFLGANAAAKILSKFGILADTFWFVDVFGFMKK
jgi:hypothetical protein